MNRSMPGLPVHHQLPEFTQTHAHWAGDAIQPSHPLSSPSPPAPNPSQHQSLFQWVNSFHEMAKYWSFSFSISPSNEPPGLLKEINPVWSKLLSSYFGFLLYKMEKLSLSQRLTFRIKSDHIKHLAYHLEHRKWCMLIDVSYYSGVKA